MKKQMQANISNLLQTMEPVMEEVIASPIRRKVKAEFKRLAKKANIQSITKDVEKGDVKAIRNKLSDLNDSLEFLEKRICKKKRK